MLGNLMLLGVTRNPVSLYTSWLAIFLTILDLSNNTPNALAGDNNIQEIITLNG